MLVSERDVLVKQEQYKDLVRDAERARLIREIVSGEKRNERFYSPTLTWLRHRLSRGIVISPRGLFTQKRDVLLRTIGLLLRFQANEP
jgi:hypothetical protein